MSRLIRGLNGIRQALNDIGSAVNASREYSRASSGCEKANAVTEGIPL